jgi:choline-sulfatase
VLPHCPYIAPRPLYDYYAERVEVPRLPDGYLDRLHPAMRVWREVRGVERIAPAQARRARAAYYGLVTLLDENVGQLLAALQEAGLAEHTATVYTSDHGEMAGEHGMWWKLSFYEGSVGIPMIWSFPGHFAAHHSVPALTSLIDVGPTLLELAGAPALPNATGRSLLPWLAGEAPAAWREWVSAEMAPAPGLRPARMVRRGPWKLNYYEGYDAPQLFNLHEDPQELDDRAAAPSCAPIREALLAEAREGWSAAEIEATLARRTADRRLLATWARAVQPPDPDYWSFPPERNVFPE